MPVYFHPRGEWSALNKEATRLFAADPDKMDIRVFAGAAHALLEFTLGFREQFPLRKKYFYFKDLDPHFTLAATALAKAGLQVTALSWDVLRNVEEFTASIDREFGFIFYPLDHPVTGEIFPFDELEKALREKGVPRLCVSYVPRTFLTAHDGHFLPFAALDRNKALAVNFSPFATASNLPLTLINLGDRLRVGMPTASALSPSNENDLQAIAAAYRTFENASSATSPMERVLAFEQKHLGGCAPLFENRTAPNTNRHFDRAVVYWRDMDGHAFISALAHEIGEPLRAPGYDGRFETTSLSRWGGVRTMDWFKSEKLDSEVIRGLVVLSVEILAHQDFEKCFIRAREKVLKDQNGN